MLYPSDTPLLLALGIGSFLGLSLWRTVRERNSCRELLVREQRRNTSRESELLQKNLEQQNELVRILATAFSSGEPLTLDDLLSRAERDFQLRSSEK